MPSSSMSARTRRSAPTLKWASRALPNTTTRTAGSARCSSNASGTSRSISQWKALTGGRSYSIHPTRSCTVTRRKSAIRPPRTGARPLGCRTVRRLLEPPEGRLGVRRHHRTVARRVEHVLLEPLVAAGEHLLGDLVLVVVVVGPQLPEQPVGPTAGLAAEQVGQFEGLLPVLGSLAADGVRVDARAGDGV